MSVKLETIGFDADDTLWHNEHFYRLTQARFAELLSDFAEVEQLDASLLAAERRNLGRYGFGIKGFVLSMIETAIEVTDQKVSASVIAEIIDAGQEMLCHPIELLPHAKESIEQLHGSYRLLLITKGDLLDQERKLALSGLGSHFDAVEIVSDKTTSIYDQIFGRYAGGPSASMMIGNSMKSDVIPALEAGAWGIYVPHGISWAVEHADPPESHRRYREIADLGDLANLIETL